MASTEDELTDAKHEIACFLACQNHQIAMKIFETKKDMLDSLVGQLKQKEPIPMSLSAEKMTTIASFWFNSASDKKVCARLQEECLPITLYTFMRENNPKETGRILKDLNKTLLKALIDLMLKVSAGHAQSEE